MTPGRPKFLFDENFPRSIVNDIARLLEHGRDEDQAELQHLLEFNARLGLADHGVWDEQWIPLAAREHWIVLAGDRGQKGIKKGQKLPRLCASHGITLVTLSPIVHHRPRFQKLLTVLSVWHELLEIGKMPSPLRFNIEPTTMQAEAKGRGKIVQKSIPKGRLPEEPNSNA